MVRYTCEVIGMNVDEWKSQLKRGTLEFAILELIGGKPRYGYELICELEKWPILTAKESTIYPLLRRLQKDGCLSSFWQDSAEGLPPRKYYTMTKAGQEYLSAMETEWQTLVSAITQMQGEKKHE